MYIKEEGIFDHHPLNSEPAYETSTSSPSKKTNTTYWIIVAGIAIVACTIVGYYVFKHYFTKSEEKKNSSPVYTD